MNYLNISAKIRIYLLKNNTPRWIIILTDLFLTLSSLGIAYLIRFGFTFPEFYRRTYFISLFIVLGIRLTFFISFRVYSGIVRYTSFLDIRRILFSVFFGSMSLILINILLNRFILGVNLIPYSIIAKEFIITLYFITNFRLLVKQVFIHLNYSEKSYTDVVIYGSQEFAVYTKSALDLDPEQRFRILAFIDSNPKMLNKTLEGIPIYNIGQLDTVLDKNEIKYFIFASKRVNTTEKNLVVKKCYNRNIKLLTVPDVNSWINGKLSFRQIREFKIEDLLEREPITLDIEKISRQLYAKTVLISGAAGSIGSEIVRQIAKFNPEKLILLDQAETPLYDLELELKEKLAFSNCEIILCDIKNQARLRQIFELFAPDIVYHAAAYKHVPMMENNPIEAFQNNVIGTKILADISSEYGVDKFIMISTDKAVNPTGIMGATKRIAEIYIQSLNDHSATSFITTRFGNVLGSNGSVIPRFLKQLEEGGPITITHPEITRFFMTIPEACQLVLEASVMGKGGEIFLFDMGKAIKILDLAKNMIKLSGHVLGKDMDIKITGLRPGEKLFEELLLESESNKPTYHPKIMVADVCKYDYSKIQLKLASFTDSVRTQNASEIVGLIKEIVPTITNKLSLLEESEKENDNQSVRIAI